MNDLRSPKHKGVSASKISNSVTSCCRLKEGQWRWDMLWKGGTSFRSISCHSTDMSPQCLWERPPLYPASSISRIKTKQKINGHDKTDRVWLTIEVPHREEKLMHHKNGKPMQTGMFFKFFVILIRTLKLLFYNLNFALFSSVLIPLKLTQISRKQTHIHW